MDIPRGRGSRRRRKDGRAPKQAFLLRFTRDRYAARTPGPAYRSGRPGISGLLDEMRVLMLDETGTDDAQSELVCARRAERPSMHRGAGRDVDGPRRAGTPRPRRGWSVESGRDVDGPRRRVAVAPWGGTWIFRGRVAAASAEASPRRSGREMRRRGAWRRRGRDVDSPRRRDAPRPRRGWSVESPAAAAATWMGRGERRRRDRDVDSPRRAPPPRPRRG